MTLRQSEQDAARDDSLMNKTASPSSSRFRHPVLLNMLRGISVYRRFLNRRPFPVPQRFLSSGKKEDGDKTVEFEDEFEEMSFNIGVKEEEEVTLKVDETPSDSENITPELASEMVSRMVAAATKKPTGPDRFSNYILTTITPHTIAVLRASRIATNEIFGTGATLEDYPINRKVTAVIDVPNLNLSAPANEALEILAGSRYKDGRILISCNKFRTSAENQAYAISRVDKLVRAAKDAVGDEVDVRELKSWEEVTDEVAVQLAGEGASQIDFCFPKKLCRAKR